MLKALASIPADHPALWGRMEVRPARPLILLDDAVVLPPQRLGGVTEWWRRRSFGVFDRHGDHVVDLSDLRGERRICHPLPRLEACAAQERPVLELPVMLYGGTLYNHYGHLLVETGRAYQLLREFRSSDLPIWFHDINPRRRSVTGLAFVQHWLRCVGIRRRVKLIRQPIQARQLISACSLYNDRAFVDEDLRPACLAGLRPRLLERLAQRRGAGRGVAYLSRHKLQGGSTKFAQEPALVARLAELKHVDVICPEELTNPQKLQLYRDYAVVAGFPQSSMHLKLFAPGDQLARQVLFVAGPQSLSSSWVNLERATGFGDAYVDCGTPESFAARDPSHSGSAAREPGFQRCNSFDADGVFEALRQLAAA
ncbi:MAG: hypothetical protein VKI63_03950 [Cyanobium sp.]|nr:hypothetical protein [Cyanobium sp.]